MPVRYPLRHHFGIVPADVLDDELAVQAWVQQKAQEEGLVPLLVMLRATKTFNATRSAQIDITVAEGFCFKGKAKRIPIVTYGDISADDWGVPDGD